MMTNNLINPNRKGWVDALRGLAILLVMYGHCVENLLGYFVFTSPVKMPLFFAITGYVFTVGDRRMFVSQIVKKIVVPWLFLGLLPPVLMIPFKGIGNVLNTFLGMMSGEKLWFIPCFIIGEVVHYLIRRFCNNNTCIIVASFACFGIGILLCQNDILNYAMINRALTVQPFFLIGFLFRTYEKKLTNLKWCWIGIAFVAYMGLCFLSLVLFPKETIDVHVGRYYNIPYCMLLIILGCFVLFTAGSKADFRSWIMSFIGQNTMVLYIWHGVAIGILVKGMSLIGWSMPINWWTALIKVVWACLICGLCSVLLNRYLPWAVGKKRNKDVK